MWKELVGDFEDKQAAFKKNRHAQDHNFTLRQTTEKLLSRSKKAYIAFLDLEAPFDTIPIEET